MADNPRGMPDDPKGIGWVNGANKVCARDDFQSRQDGRAAIRRATRTI
jgi:hypothetical protein